MIILLSQSYAGLFITFNTLIFLVLVIAYNYIANVWSFY